MLRSAVILSVVALVGCGPPGFETQRRQLSLYDGEMVGQAALVFSQYKGQLPILEGTAFCPQVFPEPQVVDTGGLFSPSVTPEPEYVRQRFTQSVEGPGQFIGPEEPSDDDDAADEEDQDRCLLLEQPGTVTWHFTARPCSEDDGVNRARDDLVSFAVRDGTGAVGWLVPTAERFAQVNMHPGAAGAWPTADTPAPGGTVAVWEGQPVSFPLGLMLDTLPLAFRLGAPIAEDAEVPDDGALHPRLRTIAGPAGTLDTPHAGAVAVSLAPGARAELHLVGVGHEFPVARLGGVALADVVSLEVVPAHLPGADDRWGMPMAARAVVRTADDTLIYGAPVVWTATGYIQVQEEGSGMFPTQPDYAEVEGREGTDFEDRARPFTAEATLTATLGPFEATADVGWDVPAPPPPSPPVVEADDAEAGVGCDQSAPGRSRSALLSLLLILGVRRRRQA